MMEIIKELPKLLENYFVYIYPGFLTIYIYNFAKARETKLDKTTLIMSIVISYTYIIIYGFIFSTSILNFHDVDYVALFIAADFIPLMWYRASRSAWGGQLLKRLGINTSLEDTAWDYIHCQDKKGREYH